jgi:hypothetical protein
MYGATATQKCKGLFFVLLFFDTANPMQYRAGNEENDFIKFSEQI